MHLAAHRDESASRIQVQADCVFRHGFNDGVRQPLAAEVFQCMFDEPPADALSAQFARDGQVGDPAFAGCGIDLRGNVTDRAAIHFGHEEPGVIRPDIVIDMSRLAPTPVAIVQHAQRGFDVPFERHAFESIDRGPFDRG